MSFVKQFEQVDEERRSPSSEGTNDSRWLAVACLYESKTERFNLKIYKAFEA